MNEMKRVIAFLLCFVMLIGYVPVGAFATELSETEFVQSEQEAAQMEITSASEEAAAEGAEGTSVPTTEATEAEESIPETTVGEEIPDGTTEPEEPDVTIPETTPAEEETETEPTGSGLYPTSVADLTPVDLADVKPALEEAKVYIDGLTINSGANDPATVVQKFGTHFTWDNEKRENSKSYLFDWSYYNGVVFEGLEYLYEVTGEEVYKDYVMEYMSSMITSSGGWAKCTNNSSKVCAGYNATHGADCYKTASLLLDAYEMSGDQRYLTVAKNLYADLDTAAANSVYNLSAAGNNYRHTWASDSTPDLWLDGLYMILPFRAEYAKHIGDTEELDLIVDRLQWVSDNMYDEDSGLFYHAANSATDNSGTFWLRSMGWYAAAMVDVMDSMSGENLAAMKVQLKKMIDGMAIWQNESNGMWLNNMAASKSSSNPYETSGTALVTYAVMKAVNKGWLDKSYADVALTALIGICDEKLSGTNLTDICFKGAPGDSNSTFYDNEGKGVGPFIMLYAEVLKYYNNAEATHSFTDNMMYIQASAVGLTGIEAENVTGDYDLDDVFSDYVAYDVELSGVPEGVEIAYSWRLLEDMDDTNLLVYHVAEDGTLTPVEYTVVTAGRRYIEFTANTDGVFVYGAQAVPEGYALSQIAISNADELATRYFVGDSLDLVTPVIVATYVKDGCEDFICKVFVGDCDVTGYDMTATGKQTVTIAYEGCSTSFNIELFRKDVSYVPSGSDEPVVSVEMTTPGVTGITIQNKTETNLVVGAVGALLAEYVAYDILLPGYVQGQEVAVTMPLPDGDGEALVYYIPDNGAAPVKLENVTDNGDGTVTFVTDHFSTYAAGRAITAVSGSVTVGGASSSSGTVVSNTKATSVTSGTYYVIQSNRQKGYLTDAFNNERTRLHLQNTQEHRWYVTRDGSNYYVQYGGPEGPYLTIDNQSSGLSNTPVAVAMNYSGTTWRISRNNYYLNNFENGAYAAGWRDNSAAGDGGSQWNLYPVLNTYNYELDTDGMDPGAKYIVVGANNAEALTLGTTVDNEGVTINGNVVTITGDPSAYEFYFTPNGTENNDPVYLLTQNGTNTIKHSGGELVYVGPSDSEYDQGQWHVVHQSGGNYRVYDIDGSNWHLNYGYAWANNSVTEFSVSSNERTVRLYKEIVDTSTGTQIDFSVTPGKVGIVEGRMYVLVPKVLIDGVATDDYTITWASEDESTATVNSVGVIQGVDDGTVNVTATLKKAGSHNLNSNPIVLTIPVTVVPTTVEAITPNTKTGTVYVNSAGTSRTGTVLTVQYGGNVTLDVAVTLNMLRNADGSMVDVSEVGTLENLTIVYGNQTVPGYTLKVVPRPNEDHPDYPNPGSVTVTKGATDTSYFQNVGVAEIQLTAAGIPMRSNVDVLLVLDLSNSMAWVPGTSSKEDAKTHETTKLYQLQKSVTEFTNILLAPNSDGSPISNTMSVVTFGGFDKEHTANQKIVAEFDDYADVTQTLVEFTNNPAYVKGAVNNLRLLSDNYLGATYPGEYGLSFDGGQTYKGNYGNTNYDYAFMQASEAINTFKTRYQINYGQTYEQSGRNMYVLFMTDGAPTNYDGVYYNYQTTNTRPDVNAQWVNANGQTVGYQIGKTNKTKYSLSEWYQFIAGGAYNASQNVIPGNPLYWADQVANIAGVKEVISIGFDIDNGGFSNYVFTEESGYPLLNVLEKLVTGKTLRAFNAKTPEKLSEVYRDLATEIAQAATNSYFVDQMGDSFNLERRGYITKFNKEENVKYTVAMDPAPRITVSTYNIFKSSQVGADITYEENGVNKTVTVTGDMVGRSYGDPTVLETVYFSADGTKAFSDKIGTITTSTIYPTDEDGNRLQTAKDKDGKSQDIVVTDYNGTNILGTDGVIDGKYFYYNTNAHSVTVTQDFDKNGDGNKDTFELEGETFCWKIGTIQDQKFVMTYNVVLEGAAEGNASAGSYETNNFATLYYTNWMGHDVYKDVQTPVLTWDSVAVSYGFYLVNAQGQPVSDRASGTVAPDFASAYRVTGVVPYDIVKLNDSGEVPLELAAQTVLPEGYKIYDEGASYIVYVDSVDGGEEDEEESDEESGSRWIITNTKEPATTYVTNYRGSDFTNQNSKDIETEGVVFDYSNTVVWFAVLWEPHAIPDVVVIDYGMPVDIDVMYNDVFGAKGSLHGIGNLDSVPYAQDKNGNYLDKDGNITTDVNARTKLTDTVHWATTHSNAFGNSYAQTTVANDRLEYGDIKIVNGEVRYTPTNMQMSQYDKFAYEVLFYNTDATSGAEVAEYYYGSVTVIPATIVYYEDSYVAEDGKSEYSFMTFKSFDKDGKEKNPNAWQSVKMNGAAEEAGYADFEIQGQDRPGVANLPQIDANNIYGYDAANGDKSTFSLGSAKKVHVNPGEYATAEFDFWGTGFDVISLTSNDTGLLMVTVTNSAGNVVRKTPINTYYGYEYTLCNVKYIYTDGAWVKEGVIEKASAGTAEGAETTIPNKPNEKIKAEMDWIVTDNTNPNAIYQVPVMKIFGLPYDKYHVRINATYGAIYDKTAADGYDLYLDAIRVYDPANNGLSDGTADKVIENAYLADKEAWPSYFEIRNQLISASDYATAPATAEFSGAIFIDGNPEEKTVKDYVSYGPNNEVYLAIGQSIAFELDLSQYIQNPGTDNAKTIVDSVHIGAKIANGSSATYAVTTDASRTTRVFATATDMYYNLTELLDLGVSTTDTSNNSKTQIVITNTGDAGIISLTNVKITFKQNPNATSIEPVTEAPFMMSLAMGNAILAKLNAVEEPEEIIPETTVPEIPEDETTEPETTEPESGEEETTEPEVTEPEATEPEEEVVKPGGNPVKKVVEIVKTAVNRVVKVIKTIFTRWF